MADVQIQVREDNQVTFEEQTTGSDGYVYLTHLPPGSAWWFKDSKGEISVLQFICPCGCGALAGIGIGPGQWEWDGNLLAPTVSPSIQMFTTCRWHGYLKKGVFSKA